MHSFTSKLHCMLKWFYGNGVNSFSHCTLNDPLLESYNGSSGFRSYNETADVKGIVRMGGRVYSVQGTYHFENI